jgi:hypothetical protein
MVKSNSRMPSINFNAKRRLQEQRSCSGGPCLRGTCRRLWSIAILSSKATEEFRQPRIALDLQSLLNQSLYLQEQAGWAGGGLLSCTNDGIGQARWVQARITWHPQEGLSPRERRAM